jgi:RNA polymerase sigma-70 factor (ECF subfamily)
MQDWNEEIDFEAMLAGEWERLVRLCTRFAGSSEFAQDLAQETLIAAWKSQGQLHSPDKLKPWTAAIARNICLNWSRQQYREQNRLVSSIDSDEPSGETELADETSIEIELDRHELTRLLDQALSLLPAETAWILIEHYIKESSHAEIAAQMKLNPGTVAVRLQRGKLTLQKVLRTGLRQEASAFGWISQEDHVWEQTNIWCPWCGQARLVGRYHKDEVFALRCPRCDPDPEMLMANLDLSKPYHARLLGNVKSYKPAYSRLLAALGPLYRRALQSHIAPCLACGAEVQVNVEHGKTNKHAPTSSQITLYCRACGWASNKSLSGLILSSPEAQHFWREYPRMKALPAQEIEVDGSLAFVTRLQSVTSEAELTVISRRDTLEPIRVRTNVKL